MPSAANPTILATRPAAMLDGLATALEKAGYSPVRFPLLEILEEELERSSDPTLRTKLLNLDLYSYVIFISRNAARIGIDMIDQLWPQLPIGVTWLTIGKGTAEELAPFDVPVTVNSGLDSEALLALPALQDVHGERVLIMKGEGGREQLEQTLSERGAQVDTLNLYQRSLPNYSEQDLAQLSDANPSAILISSGEALENLAELADQLGMFANTPIVVPSKRVAEIGAELGFIDIIVAKGADDLSMIDALNQRFKKD
jgi:uroporphyrinogen-III synthase